MPLLDLSLVSRSLVGLLDRCVRASPAWPTGAPLVVGPEPPDKLSGVNAIGYYLYHVTEDAGYRNLPPPGQDHTPVRLRSLALNLYYLLTARCDAQDAEGFFREQLMMGLAMKCLHDFPQIDDNTAINGVKVLAAGLRGSDNRLRLSLTPVAPEGAVDYWTAGSSPLRLASYYQVAVALIEPEEPTRRATRVLQYGVFAFTSGSPFLEGSRSTLSFTIPGETIARSAEVQPAMAPVGGQIIFFGVDLAGERTTLLLNTSRWTAPQEVGAEWGVTGSADRLYATLQESAGSEEVLPGVYTAQAKVVRRKVAPGGLEREFEFTSNETPFMIAPRIDAVSAPTPQGIVNVTGYIFQHGSFVAGTVQVMIGAERLAQRTTAGPLAQGQFRVVDAANLSLRLPASALSGQLVPLRIFVNGAESLPLWVEAP